MLFAIIINAIIVYFLLFWFSAEPKEAKKQKAIEISAVTIIGFAIISFTVSPLIGFLGTLLCLALWAFCSLRFFGKLTSPLSAIAAVVILVSNLLLSLLFQH